MLTDKNVSKKIRHKNNLRMKTLQMEIGPPQSFTGFYKKDVKELDQLQNP